MVHIASYGYTSRAGLQTCVASNQNSLKAVTQAHTLFLSLSLSISRIPPTFTHTIFVQRQQSFFCFVLIECK